MVSNLKANREKSVHFIFFSIVLFILLLLLYGLVNKPVLAYYGTNSKDIISTGHLKLLAVQEMGNKFRGSVADLFLTIKPGTGKVFLNTEPLTKFDTQLVTRFARDIACNYAAKDCTKYDFYYSITSDSPIIGGSSAGAATAILTYILLMGYDYDDLVTITGTINSGGIIGPVGGLKEKIEAGAKHGIKKILIPYGQAKYEEENQTLDLIAYGQKMGVEIHEVKDIFDALYYFTNIKVTRFSGNITPPVEYQKRMQNISLLLCNKSHYLFEELINKAQMFFNTTKDKILEDINSNNTLLKSNNITIGLGLGDLNRRIKINITLNCTSDVCSYPNIITIGSYSKNITYIKFINYMKDVLKRKEKSMVEFNKQNYYSSASLCYTNNVKLKYWLIKIDMLSHQQDFINKETDLIFNLTKKIQSEQHRLEHYKIATLSDLEIYAIINQRLYEAESYLKKLNLSVDIDSYAYNLANAIERLHSIESWKHLFGIKSRKYEINQKTLKNSCLSKVNEAMERYYYLNYLLGSVLSEQIDFIKKDINKAYDYYRNKKYVLCLFQASYSKAETDLMLDSLTIDQDNIASYINAKKFIAKQNILYQMSKGNFPISGYSYYQYALSLENTTPYSALSYLDYALELSNLDMYFNAQTRYYSTNNTSAGINAKDNKILKNIKQTKYIKSQPFNLTTLIVFVVIFLIGFFVGTIRRSIKKVGSEAKKTTKRTRLTRPTSYSKSKHIKRKKSKN